MKNKYIVMLHFGVVISISLLVGVVNSNAEEVIKVDFAAPLFDGVLREIQDKKFKNSQSNVTDALYEKLVGFKSYQNKFLINYLAFIDENKKLSKLSGKLKIVNGFDWFLNFAGPTSEDKFDSQIHILGGFAEGCNSFQVVVLGLQSSRYLIQEIPLSDLNAENIVDKVFEMIVAGLKYSDKVIPIYADKVLNVEGSEVQYAFSTHDNKTLEISLNYDDMHENIQRTSLIMKEMVEDVGYVGCFPSKEKIDICLEFGIKDGKIVNTRIYPKTLKEKPFRLTAVSKGRYEVFFNFADNADLGVQISPKSNPYAPSGYELKLNSKEFNTVNNHFELFFTCEEGINE